MTSSHRYDFLYIGFFLVFLTGLLMPLTAKAGIVRDIKIIGQIDTQYDFVDADDNRSLIPAFGDPDGDGTDAYFLAPVPAFANTSEILLRRLRFGVDAKFAGSFQIKIVGALDLKNSSGPAPYADRRDLLDQAWAAWRGEIGHLRIGYAKLPFGMENLTPATELLVIERSLATNYFTGVTQWGGVEGRPYGYVCTPLGLGARGVSVLWDGALVGVKYHVAAASNMYNPFGGEASNRRQDWGIYVGLAHEQKIGAMFYDVGINAAWHSQGVAYFPIAQQRFAELYALNPYLQFDYDRFRLRSEYFYASAKHGQFITGGFYDDGAPDRATVAPTANSHGVNVVVDYDIFQNRFAIVGRYSFLDTGGAGFSSGFFSDVIAGAPQPLETNNFDRGYALYGGLVYRHDFTYASARFSLGYEFVRSDKDLSFRQLIDSVDASSELGAQAPGLLSASRVNIHSIRFRVQSSF